MGWHYAALEDRFARLGHLEGALAILHWDTAVCMPEAASAARGEQVATLKRLAHDLLTADETGELLAGAEAESDLDPWQRANLREAHRRFRRARALEPALVEALARATNACEMTWREARRRSDFAMLRPALEEVVRLVREAARMSGAALGLEPYDALLDEHQPELRDALVAPLLDRLAAELPSSLDAAIARNRPFRAPRGPFPIEAQKKLAERLMARLGFDFRAGRLDASTHPFCGGTPADIRITSRWREDDVGSALMAVLHETGHALYEAGLPRQWLGQPVGEARGIVVHESQSLLLEMQVCRSPAFLRFLAGELEAAFGPDPAWTAANLRALWHRVERGFIRVDADEVSYPLHVILRWRLEKALLAGELAVADLPGAWAEGMRALLGVTPPDDARGCLQDIHWPVGAFGYFPCYTLGALLAAQLARAARRELAGLDDEIARGDIARLLAWLRARVHARGSQPGFEELIEEATGGPLAAEPFLDHLRARYLERPGAA
ncbi:MAG: carboxypeptidase M32 [Geminicoccaceae bacterium]|nr:carboxypeptidase M32 [Geminicoccaceae bacterium]